MPSAPRRPHPLFPAATLLALALAPAACDLDSPPALAPDAAAEEARALASDPTPGTIRLSKIGGFEHGGALAAEISAYDEVSRRLFVVNGALGTVDVMDLRDPARPSRITTLNVGGAANSVAARGGIVAVAIEGATRTDPGTVAFYRAPTLALISTVTVGALPDMVTFTPDGKTVLVANEGEPNDDYTIDPVGSVSVIDVTNVNAPTVRTAGFEAFNGRRDELLAAGVRIFGPGASVAQDMEPEYITVSEDGRTAWVALQENNALAVLDVQAAMITAILPLGYKDHSLPGNGMDVSDQDGSINIRTWPVLGMYQPDAIDSYSVDGQTYIVTANEGDSRDWPGYSEVRRVRASATDILPLNPDVFTDAVCGGPCTDAERLGRLNVTTTMGFNEDTGVYDALYAFGARSFSIWTAGGQLVWDSGDAFEQITASRDGAAARFNASNSNNTFDNRSDDKGPEPEAVVIGRLGAKVFAFIALERVGGVMVYDITNPQMPFFVDYLNTRNGNAGDLGPEGLVFIPAVRSPNKRPLLISSNEVSGTTAVFEVELR